MKTLPLLCASGLWFVLCGACQAAEAAAQPAVAAASPQSQSSATPPPATAPASPLPAVAPAPATTQAKGATEARGGTEAQRYCQNIAAAAADARFALQAKQLAELETHLRGTMAALEARQAEYREILAKRDAAMKQAAATLVGIYAKMKPDAAAAQLAALDDVTAAAVLVQLNARQASAILNEVSPERAVKLVNTIAGNTAQAADGKKS